MIKFSGLIVIHNSDTDVIGNWFNISQFSSNYIQPGQAKESQAVSWVSEGCSAKR